MTDFDAMDALPAGPDRRSPLPAAGERRALREGLNLSRTQVAQALGVSPLKWSAADRSQVADPRPA